MLKCTGIVLLFAGLSANAAGTELTSFLNSVTLGNDGYYNKILSPAKSLNLNLSEADRTKEVNNKILNEINGILDIFTNTVEDNKLNSVRQFIGKIDQAIIKNSGANIEFIHGSPSAAFSRTLIMIEKKGDNKNLSAEKVMNTFSSYKRSALPSTYFYEYSDASNLAQSQIVAISGNEESWKLPRAAAPIAENKDLVLKKCRQIFGWKCVTSIYKTGQLLSAESALKYFYAGIYNLADNQDNPEFLNDKRSYNQITGSTALYVVKESEKWIILYGIDSQWNTGSISFAPLILDEFLKDSKRIRERLSLDLKLSTEQIK